jgi:glycosyltransferase involved in cell wall biosynthesis
MDNYKLNEYAGESPIPKDAPLSAQGVKSELSNLQTELSVTKKHRDHLQTALAQSQTELASAWKAVAKLEQAVASAQQWQKSWFKRTFHRWRSPIKAKLRPKAGNPNSHPPEEKRAPVVCLPQNKKAQRIEQSGLFDKQWYLAQYGKQVDGDPIVHYLKKGASLGFNPSPQFNTQGYLDLYQDVADSKLNPLLHYISSGKKEGRIPNPASGAEIVRTVMEQCASRSGHLCPSKKTVLLVTHEMSRTGAPILVLNIAKQLRKKFNIIVLTLKPGGLVKEFTEACDLLIGSKASREHAYSERTLCQVFQSILLEYRLEFALVNSIASFVAVRALWENDIPLIHLIHEFASYTRPRGRFVQSALYSSLQVFPATVVRDNAILDAPHSRTAQSIIMPQGRNCAPGESGNVKLLEQERQRIRTTFRPAGFPQKTVVVAGMGTVQLRKGVDLFVACAKRVSELHPQTPFRFVWIGDGYCPEHDLSYSGYIADQIQRSGLKDVFTMMEAVAEIEEAYKQSDILFLSSRLDPLPLVSQDSMAHGKPVFCFENATGIAEYLKQDQDAAFGIIPYLDIEVAAQRICRLIDDGDHRNRVGEGCRKLSATVFCFENYVKQLETLGLEQAAKKKIEKADRALILQSKIVMPEFCFRPSGRKQPVPDELAIMEYMSGWRTGIEPRKPWPGFHPGIYAEHNDIKDRDPLAHYLEAGRPDGPWNYQVIGGDRPKPVRPSLRIGLHLHLYFPDVAEQILHRLKSVRTPLDLLISVPSKEMAREVGRLAARCVRGELEIRIVPNRGRDIGPFLTEFGEDILSNFDIIGHIHTKKTLDLKEHREFVQSWTDFLYENLLGGKMPMADNILGSMSSDETIGLVFPDDPFAVGWGENRDHAVALADRLNVSGLLPKAAINFPVGMMFWARTAAIRPLLKLGLTWDDYPPEPLPYDSTMLHAMERIVPYIVESTGFRNAVTHVSGITR